MDWEKYWIGSDSGKEEGLLPLLTPWQWPERKDSLGCAHPSLRESHTQASGKAGERDWESLLVLPRTPGWAALGLASGWGGCGSVGMDLSLKGRVGMPALEMAQRRDALQCAASQRVRSRPSTVGSRSGLVGDSFLVWLPKALP